MSVRAWSAATAGVVGKIMLFGSNYPPLHTHWGSIHPGPASRAPADHRIHTVQGPALVLPAVAPSPGGDVGPWDRSARGPFSSHVRCHRCVDRTPPRKSLATTELSSPWPNLSVPSSRNSSRHWCRSEVSPPPCGYRIFR